MQKEFLNIEELSEFLSIKKSTLYSMVENGDLPHYKIGRLIRFKRDEVDAWIEGHKKEALDPEKKAKEILKGVKNPRIDIEKIVSKAVEQEKGSRYNLAHGKSDRKSRGLSRKEVPYGAL